MSEDTWVDVELEEQLSGDAQRTHVDLDWGTLSDALDEPGWRDTIASQSTFVRRFVGTFVLVVLGGLLVGMQGVRGDLDATGWLSFIVAGWVLAGVGAGGTLLALRSTAATPLTAWPWIPGSWAFLLIWSAIGPWPGMTGVPPEMHMVCFSATSTMVLFATVCIGLLEQGTRPVPWRLGLAAAGAGCVAFVFQSIFCPGIDYIHLIVGHGGASIVGAIVAFAAAWALNGLLFGSKGSQAQV